MTWTLFYITEIKTRNTVLKISAREDVNFKKKRNAIYIETSIHYNFLKAAPACSKQCNGPFQSL